jgi:hypothetical protein
VIKLLLISFLFAISAHAEEAAPASGLLKVSSEYNDVGIGQRGTVEGVGSLIVTGANRSLLNTEASTLRAGRYFVLTAGHVSMGDNLKVFTAHGQTLKIKSVHQDTLHDLALIEIDSDDLGNLPRPLAYYLTMKRGTFKGTSLTTSFLASFLATNSTNSKEAILEERSSGIQYKATPIEGTIGLVNGGGRLTSVLTPEWMNTPLFDNKITDINYQVLKGPTVSQIVIPRAFARGYSGAPILVPYYTPEHRPVYNLAGILTLSDSSREDAKSTVAAGPYATIQFIQASLEDRTDTNKRVEWFLYKGHFGKIEGDSIILFLKSGPIGNGVVIDGHKQNDLQDVLEDEGIPDLTMFANTKKTIRFK